MGISQDFLTDEPIHYTFNIKYGNQTGTGFLVKYKGRGYLITAKHIFSTASSLENVTVEISRDTSWIKVTGNILIDKNKNVDIAVLTQPGSDSIRSGFSIDSTIGVIYGDEGYFFGFPYGIQNKDKDYFKGYPLALVKRAGLSGVINEAGVTYYLLDGHNNPGFSGGPVVFKDRSKPNDRNWYLVSVISAYVPQQNDLRTPVGTFKYSENSGIIVSISASHIKAIIDAGKAK